MVIYQKQQPPTFQEVNCPWASDPYRLTLTLHEDIGIWEIFKNQTIIEMLGAGVQAHTYQRR